ncbi:unnamed protein product [Closterium sp. NIES-54]
MAWHGAYGVLGCDDMAWCLWCAGMCWHGMVLMVCWDVMAWHGVYGVLGRDGMAWRQYRMAGLAMLDIMQRVASTWHAMASATSSQNNKGSHDATSSREAMCSPAAALDSEAAAPPALPDSPSPSMPPASPTAPTAATAPDSAVAGRSQKGSNSNRGKGEEGRRRRGRGSNSKSKGRGQGGEVIGGWRDVFDSIVRWRQIAEPTDTVAWIDALK